MEQLSLFPANTVPYPRSVVYVLTRQAPCGRIYKIGTTTRDPQRRARELNARLVAFTAGGRQLERILHRRFTRSRLSGTEWFLPSRDVVEWVDQFAAIWN